MESAPSSPEAAAPEASTPTETAAPERIVTDNGVDTGTEMSNANGKYKSVSERENGYTEAQ